MKIVMGEALKYNSFIHVGSHHYAERFARDGNDVFWLGGTIHFGNLVGGLLGRSVDQDLVRQWRHGPLQVLARLWAYHPFTLLPYRNVPLLSSKAVLESTLALTVPAVGDVLAHQGFGTADLLWLSQSHSSLAVLRTVPHAKMAYRMSDSFCSFGNVPPSMAAAEAEICSRADVVFATARHIVDEARQLGARNVQYLPNGVDNAHFTFAVDAPVPPELAGLARPRVIYVGSIAAWFDIGLVAHCARALPTFQFILIGPAQIDLASLAALPNVTVLGPKPYSEVPAYLHHADVAIIPFLRTPLTEATNPVKLFEYFAAGLPVVSVELHEIAQMNSPALLASTPEAFVHAIEKALVDGTRRPEFASFARANDWDERIRFIKMHCLR